MFAGRAEWYAANHLGLTHGGSPLHVVALKRTPFVQANPLMDDNVIETFTGLTAQEAEDEASAFVCSFETVLAAE